MNLSRRMILKRGGIALVSAGASTVWGPSFLRQLVFAAEPARASGGRKILVCIFQRGAVDGLSMVVPFGDAEYYKARNEIAIGAPPAKKDEPPAIDLDGFFGFHPALDSLAPLYKQGHLAVIHACGSPSATRSHFDAQDFMECGVVDNKSINSGWINRALIECPEDRAKITPFRAVSMTSTLPKCLHGDHEALAIPNVATFGVGAVGGHFVGCWHRHGDQNTVLHPQAKGGGNDLRGLFRRFDAGVNGEAAGPPPAGRSRSASTAASRTSTGP